MNKRNNELQNGKERMEDLVEGLLDGCIYPWSSHRYGSAWGR